MWPRREEPELAAETAKEDQAAKRTRALYTLAMVNTGIWALAMIGLVFVIQRSPGARGLYVILAGGTAVSIALLSVTGKAR